MSKEEDKIRTVSELMAESIKAMEDMPWKESPSITETLAERDKRYGCFKEHARITQNIKRAMADSPNWGKLSDDKREALEMLAHKVGRILNGDPEWHDSCHDMEGYSRLVAEGLVAESDSLTPQAIINLALKNLGENDDSPITLTNETRVVWRGGLYPAISPNKMVRVKFRGGVEFSNERLAKFVSWQHTGGDADVVEYIYKNTPKDDGWIQWGGGECPVGADIKAQVKLRDSSEGKLVTTSDCYRWTHDDCGDDIIAYRICEKK